MKTLHQSFHKESSRHMFRKPLGITALAAAIAMVACSGGVGGSGAGGSGGGGLYGPPPTSPPQQSNLPVAQKIAGKPGFANPANNRTLYFLDVDTPTGAKCSGGCLSVWPVIAPSNGAHAQGGFAIITRSDGTGMQWAYKNHPLYMYAGDTGPDQANGEGIPLAGGHWHVARPTT
jgi:predicted lipoprotein with Yx(FWY)xxD motif